MAIRSEDDCMSAACPGPSANLRQLAITHAGLVIGLVNCPRAACQPLAKPGNH